MPLPAAPVCLTTPYATNPGQRGGTPTAIWVERSPSEGVDRRLVGDRLEEIPRLLDLAGRLLAHGDAWDRERYGRAAEMETVDPGVAGRSLDLDVGRGREEAEQTGIWASPRWRGAGLAAIPDGPEREAVVGR